MALFGKLFAAAGDGEVYSPKLGVGLFASIGIAVGVFAFYSVIQAILGVGVAAFMLGDATDLASQVKGMIIATLPAAGLAALAAFYLAGIGAGDKFDVLSLRWPKLSPVGWLVLLVSFLGGLYLLLELSVLVFDIDVSQYTPKPDGSSPDTGSAGLVKEAMYGLSNNPLHFWLAFASVAVGAPLAEEFIFRGQLFAALSRSKLGNVGAVSITSVLWAALHLTEPLLSVSLILVMGFILGWLLIRFRSLYVTMACHGIWNAVYSLLVHYGQ